MSGERCANCMEEIGPVRVCPRCGYDNLGAQRLSFVLAPNTILYGKYLTGRVLGQGGFGITYVGFDLALERKVAIKEYYPVQQVSRNNAVSNHLTWNSTQVTVEQWQAGRDSFLKEARKMAKMIDIHEIVRVLDVFNDNNTAYIVMDYVEGDTLKSILEKKGPMHYADAVELLLPLIRALDKAHAQGMIHRDISPDNIMIRKDGSLRLLDFGAAKDLTVQNAAYSMKLAKNGFSPIEQYASNGQTGPWTDVYAMCATIYYAVTGRMVPQAPDRMDVDPLSFENIPTGPISPEQQAVLRNGLAVLAKNRIQTMSALAERLERSLRKAEPLTYSTEPSRAQSSGTSGSGWVTEKKTEPAVSTPPKSTWAPDPTKLPKSGFAPKKELPKSGFAPKKEPPKSTWAPDPTKLPKSGFAPKK